jgi:hypothetical protein
MHGYNEKTIKMDDLGGTPILGTPYLVQGSGIFNGMFNTDEDFPKRTPFFLHGELYKKSPFVGDFSQVAKVSVRHFDHLGRHFGL